MNYKEFFNDLSFKWDNNYEDEKKLNYIVDLANIKKGSRILDVGTGTGILIKYLLKKYPVQIIGIDIAKNMINIARNKYNEKNVKFIIEDIFKYNENGFDYIFLFSVYPHLKNKEYLFYHLASLLNKNGKIIIAHSQNRNEINKVHSKKEFVKNDLLPPANIVASIMSKCFKIDTIIENNEIYYISGVLY